eukprot:scaffold6562_cov120-Isochrysis_galbana.AAC.6
MAEECAVPCDAQVGGVRKVAVDFVCRMYCQGARTAGIHPQLSSTGRTDVGQAGQRACSVAQLGQCFLARPTSPAETAWCIRSVDACAVTVQSNTARNRGVPEAEPELVAVPKQFAAGLERGAMSEQPAAEA